MGAYGEGNQAGDKVSSPAWNPSMDVARVRDSGSRFQLEIVSGKNECLKMFFSSGNYS